MIKRFMPGSPRLQELNKVLFIIIILLGLAGPDSLARETRKPSDIYNQAEDNDQKVDEVLSEVEINEGKEAAEIIEYLHLLENIEFFQQDMEKVQVLDLLIFSSQ